MNSAPMESGISNHHARICKRRWPSKTWTEGVNAYAHVARFDIGTRIASGLHCMVHADYVLAEERVSWLKLSVLN